MKKVYVILLLLLIPFAFAQENYVEGSVNEGGSTSVEYDGETYEVAFISFTDFFAELVINEENTGSLTDGDHYVLENGIIFLIYDLDIYESGAVIEFKLGDVDVNCVDTDGGENIYEVGKSISAGGSSSIDVCTFLNNPKEAKAGLSSNVSPLLVKL